MFCPKCGDEYKDGYDKCVECNIGLVAELPVEELNTGPVEKLIIIAQFSKGFDAHLAKSKLESEGIEGFLADEHIVQMNWLYSNLVGGVKLQVRESDLVKAKEALGIACVSEPKASVPEKSFWGFYMVMTVVVLIVIWIIKIISKLYL